MEKHISLAVVLVCTLSTRVGGNERTLPVLDIRRALNKKLAGIH